MRLRIWYAASMSRRDMACFNGAPAFRLRIWRLRTPLVNGWGMLQWGPSLAAEDMKPCDMASAMMGKLQWGPSLAAEDMTLDEWLHSMVEVLQWGPSLAAEDMRDDYMAN